MAKATAASGGAGWPADQVERRAVDALVPDARNARTHSEAQVDQIAASIREWGWTMPVLVDDDGGIIAGHGRVMAAQKLGITDVPVMVARGWTEEQRRAYVLADNQISLLSEWDMDALSGELRALDDAGFDLPMLGFDNAELAELIPPVDDSDPVLSGIGDTELGDVSMQKGKAVSRPGDVWLLGNHRLMCGNAKDFTHVDVVIRRWQNLTGKEASLDGDGRSFAAVANEGRAPAVRKRGGRKKRGKS